MNDRLGSDTYDSNGNTVAASLRDAQSGTETAFDYEYDFENRILSAQSASSAVQILYDGDGNRVEKTVTDAFGTRTTRYLVDDRNPTGYSQVLAELDGGTNVLVTYTIGLDQISETRHSALGTRHSYYGYDGHGNVRFLTDEGGHITDTYEYDAFGTLLARSGSTPNNYLYCGEQFDPDLGLYFLRARYMDPDRGRFWTMDVWEGLYPMPSSLHRYVYASANPISFSDPSGLRTLVETMEVSCLSAFLRVTLAAANVIASACTFSRLADEIPGSQGPMIPVPPCQDDDQGWIYYHYTDSPISAFYGGIRQGTWVTDTTGLPAYIAKAAMGLGGLPSLLLAIRIKDSEMTGGNLVNYSSKAPLAGIIPVREWVTIFWLPYSRVVYTMAVPSTP